MENHRENDGEKKERERTMVRRGKDITVKRIWERDRERHSENTKLSLNDHVPYTLSTVRSMQRVNSKTRLLEPLL